jgi:predicted DNA-binding transcriptional regulator AlpA
MTIEHLLTAKSLSERIGVTEGCLAKWRLTGEGPRYINVGRRIAYDPKDVQSWLDARRVSSTSQEAA